MDNGDKFRRGAGAVEGEDQNIPPPSCHSSIAFHIKKKKWRNKLEKSESGRLLDLLLFVYLFIYCFEQVVYNVGLCICLYDITKLEDSYIFPGDGASHTKVHFRYVVFHPFLDEILIGEIKSCSQDGVHVSLGFFDDIVIPPESLQQPAKFDEAEQVWVWEYETEEGAHDLYMDIGEEIRFRVMDETFVDTSPTGPSSAEASTSNATEEVQKKEAPYTLVGSISEPGLGLLSWWTNS
ncbi:DNA-directed RNA polymerase III subunit RPC8 [Nothoprocta perdicaria]|uniref:DNA-directed RNA polymerase III subunit RPC8 n=1 Tax=Nothoprocta perdicaria TaxID=30464 RepID=UPI000E1BC072|nr:DNA-directed RNA polymerase III subunit RPC8 [Nothoprocta perdicaria]